MVGITMNSRGLFININNWENQDIANHKWEYHKDIMG